MAFWQNEYMNRNYMIVLLFHSLFHQLPFHVQNINSTTLASSKCIGVCLWTEVWRAFWATEIVAANSIKYCIIFWWAVKRTDISVTPRLGCIILTALRITMHGVTRLETKPTTWYLCEKKPLMLVHVSVLWGHFQGTSSNCSTLYLIITTATGRQPICS